MTDRGVTSAGPCITLPTSNTGENTPTAPWAGRVPVLRGALTPPPRHSTTEPEHSRRRGGSARACLLEGGPACAVPTRVTSPAVGTNYFLTTNEERVRPGFACRLWYLCQERRGFGQATLGLPLSRGRGGGRRWGDSGAPRAWRLAWGSRLSCGGSEQDMQGGDSSDPVHPATPRAPGPGPQGLHLMSQTVLHVTPQVQGLALRRQVRKDVL